MTSTLGSYNQCGSCFGYGSDYTFSSVTLPICTKKDVYFAVTFASAGSGLSDLQSEMPPILEAVYASIR